MILDDGQRLVSTFLDGRPLINAIRFHGAYDLAPGQVISDFDEAIFKGNLGGAKNDYYLAYKTVPDGTVCLKVKHVFAKGSKLVPARNVSGSTGVHIHVVATAKVTGVRYRFCIDPTILHKCTSVNDAIKLSFGVANNFQWLNTLRSIMDQIEKIGVDPGDGVYREYGFSANEDGSFLSTYQRSAYLAYLVQKVIEKYPHVIGLSRKRLILAMDILFNVGEQAEVSEHRFSRHIITTNSWRRKGLKRMYDFIKGIKI